MKSLALGLGMVAGAAIALSVVDSMYPDVRRRMMRDGRRMVRHTRRTMCDLGDMIAR